MRARRSTVLIRETARDFAVGLAIFAIVFALAALDSRAAYPAPRASSSGSGEAGLMLRHRGGGGARGQALGTAIEIAVSGPVARTVVTQRFRNDGTDWSRGRYAFPLPEGAAVDSLTITVGDRVIEGVITPRETVAVLAAQARAAGIEVPPGPDAERANQFTTTLTNIGPGETVTVRLAYRETLRPDDLTFALRVPLGVAQERVGLHVKLEPGFSLGAIASLRHAVAVSRDGDGAAEVELAGDAPASGDFTLTWRPKVPVEPEVGAFREHFGDNAYVMAVMTPPRQPAALASARDVVFVLDTSGSMAGPILTQVKTSLARALEGLREGDRFNVIRFASDVEALFDVAREATPANLAQARDFIANLRTAGGTQIGAALTRALTDAKPQETRLRQIVLVTDGAAHNESEILAEIAAKRGRSRLFMVGIGAAPNEIFMRRASALGRGAYTHIAAEAEVGDRLDALAARLARPVLTDIRAQWTAGVRAEAWPDPVPDLYAGEQLVLAAQLSSSKGSLTLTGSRNGEAWKAVLPLADARAGGGIAELWARRKIASLEARRWLGQDESLIDAAIRQLALEHGIVSAATDMVAMEGGGRARPGDAPASLAGATHVPWPAKDILRPMATAARAPLAGNGNPLSTAATAGGDGSPSGRGKPAARVAPAASPAKTPAALAAVPEIRHATSGILPSPSVLAGPIDHRLLLVAIMALFFATMCAVTLGFWRQLSREYVSTRRPRRGI